MVGVDVFPVVFDLLYIYVSIRSRAEHLLGVFEASEPDASVIPELRVLQEKLGDHFSSTR